jgi:hypothetical protein
MDGMTAAPREVLRIVNAGVRYGVAITGKVAWLPPEMWAPAAELQRRMDALNAEADRLNKLIAAAQQAADEAGGVQTPWREE